MTIQLNLRLILKNLRQCPVLKLDRILAKLQFGIVLIFIIFSVPRLQAQTYEDGGLLDHQWLKSGSEKVDDLIHEVSQIYGGFAEKISDIDCPDYSYRELLAYIRSFEGTGLPLPNGYQDWGEKKLLSLAESLFFKKAIKDYLDENRCTRNKVQSFLKSSDSVLEYLMSDIAPKIIYLRKLERDIRFIESKTFAGQFFRSNTTNKEELKLRAETEKKLKLRHDELMNDWNFVHKSIWQVNTKTMKSYIRTLIDEKFELKEVRSILAKGKSSLLPYLRIASLRSTMLSMQKELNKDYSDLIKVAHVTFRPQNKSEELRISRSVAILLHQSFQTWRMPGASSLSGSQIEDFDLQVSFRKKLYCHLNNRYHQGPERIENGIFIAAVFATLGESILFNLGRMLKLGKWGLRIDRFAESLALYAGSFEVIEIINKVGLNCLKQSYNVLGTSELLCSKPPDTNEIMPLIVKEVEEKNCIHSLVSSLTKSVGKIYHASHMKWKEENPSLSEEGQEVE